MAQHTRISGSVKERLALGSLVLGILSVIVVFSSLIPYKHLTMAGVGLALGAVALNSSRRGIAVAGVVICGMVLLWPLIGGFILSIPFVPFG